MSNRLKNILLSLLSGALMALAWPPLKLPALLFIGFVPLFLLEFRLAEREERRWFKLYLYLGLFTFNLLTTWWVWHASAPGSVAMLLANTLLMCLPFLAYSFTKKIIGIQKAAIGFIFYWLAFEHLHFSWDVAYPWLCLGNGFATSPELVQFYEVTGALGGTFWILLINVLVFLIIVKGNMLKRIGVAISLILPLLWSIYLGSTQSKCPAPTVNMMVVQPNIDPYAKFNKGEELEQVKSFIQMMEDEITEETELILLPETAIVEYMDEDELHSSLSIRYLISFLRKHPHAQILTGASTYKFYYDQDKASLTARETPDGMFYDSYNTALMIDTGGVKEIYHKSRLVPGVEKMPYPKLLKFMEYFTIDMGGISGSLGQDSVAKVFDANELPDIAPLICYESVFGDYANDFVSQGANIIAIITNDGWWENTPGYKQHMHYARLRAIENRRDVVRSANTGISCHIDDNGNILEQLGWWKRGVLHLEVEAFGYKTVYSRLGDYIGRIASFLAVFLLLSVWVRSRTKDLL